MENLVHKFLGDTITEDELQMLKKWLEDPKNKEYLKKVLTTNYELDSAYRKIDAENAYQRIVEATSAATKQVIKLRRKPRTFLNYAAAILVVLGVASIFYLSKEDKAQAVPFEESKQVTLQLEDGSFTALEEESSGMITNKKGEHVVRQERNTLVYTPLKETREKLVYNILRVPYGKRFKIQLADSTLVVLNAGTTLRYPKSFNNPESREVFLSGEAYFTVSDHADQPFIVRTDNMNIRVLGTQFNVSSYKNEKASSTVLVEGKVEVYKGEEKKISESISISPGEMASAIDGGFEVMEVDVMKHIAWVDGTLFFTNDPFENIMKELERHYDITIINRNRQLDQVRYTGTFRAETIFHILQVFQRNTEFEFEVKNDTIILDTPNTQNQKQS
ncbi:FecR family protein [Pareuzebyella sediminis]|uniref:FecR family protein n=1 Tax=Pareuzebyella sediminis TaxID=2607998 RepID=UPI0011EF5CAE|nr:FecR domain-containing protein [Pareuzebyella sediminis]